MAADYVQMGEKSVIEDSIDQNRVNFKPIFIEYAIGIRSRHFTLFVWQKDISYDITNHNITKLTVDDKLY